MFVVPIKTPKISKLNTFEKHGLWNPFQPLSTIEKTRTNNTLPALEKKKNAKQNNTLPLAVPLASLAEVRQLCSGGRKLRGNPHEVAATAHRPKTPALYNKSQEPLFYMLKKGFVCPWLYSLLHLFLGNISKVSGEM